MHMTVIGTGYLGAVHAAAMADLGHDVLGVDVDPDKVAALSEGRPTFYEPEFPGLLRRNLESGRLRFTTSLPAAASFGDVHFLCVGTPQRAGSDAADLSHVDAVVAGMAPHLRRNCLVVGKSTVPVGTAARIGARIAALAPAGPDAEVAWNPEFLREGYAVQDTLRPDRIVVGATSQRAHDTLRTIYAPLIARGAAYLDMDPTTAELVKVAANSFLATKISFINAMARVCEQVGGDVTTLADAIGRDPRIGRHFLSAGLGFGGGCLPKDIRGFLARTAELGIDDTVSFLRQVDDINQQCRSHTVELARGLLGGCLAGRRVGVLGAAFKPDSDDVRDSPALSVAVRLRRAGARVRVHDPEAVDQARAACSEVDYTTEVEKAFEGAELVVHATEWRQYRQLDPVLLRPLVRTPRLLDARNALDIDRWRAAGWTVRALGRPLR